MMKTAKRIILLTILAVGTWSCSHSPTDQQPTPFPYPPNAISHLPPGSKIVASDSLYKIIPDSLLTARQQKQLTDLLKSDKYIISAHLARYNSNVETLLKQADTLAFPISIDSAYVATKNYFNVSSPANNPTTITWAGNISPHSRGNVSVFYTLKGDIMDGHITFKLPFIIGLKLQDLNHNTIAIIQVKQHPYHKQKI